MKQSIFLGAAVLFLAAGTVRAQPFEAGSEVVGVRGAIGLGLVAGELTMTIEAGAGVTNPWLLSLIPLAVAGGGAAGGYYMEQESAAAGVAMLAVGMTLLVPSILLTLVLSSETYEMPEETEVTAEPPPGGGGAATASRSSALARAARTWRAPPSLVSVRNGGVKLGMPSLGLLEAPAQSLYPAAPAAAGFEYHLSLINWTF